MPKKDIKKEDKKIGEIETEKELEIPNEEISEKELLKQAELREKEKKAHEESVKAAEKEASKEEKAKELAEKKARKDSKRVKPRHGKKHQEMSKMIEKGKDYSVDEAISLVLQTSTAKFDATVEAHVKIHAKEQNIRGMVVLPGGVVKEKKILEVDESNVDNVIEQIKSGKIDFDTMVTTAKTMPKLAQLAKILGPKGLMPSPKAGTVVEDLRSAVAELKGGKVEYRADKQNIVHLAIGKVSFGQEKIKQNYDALIAKLPKRVESIYLATTMGPSVKVAK